GDNLHTIDLSKSGQAQIACPGSKEFLTVLIQPKGTGDFDAQVYWDSNMDGKLDHSTTISGISGICANGYIVCDPGTWNNCRNYLIKYNDNSKQLYFPSVGLYDLSGCSCINNSCGNNLVWTNLGYVLKLFGGAVAQAFENANPRYAISSSTIDGTAIYFYGQEAQNCSIASSRGGIAYPEQYYNSTNATSLQASVEQQTLSQQSDPQSYYNLMVQANSAQQAIVQSCSIQRNAWEEKLDLYDIISPVSGNGGTVRPCGDRCIQVVLGWEGDNYWCGRCNLYELYYDLMVKRPDLIESATLIYAAWDDWMQFWFNGQLIWNGPYGNWTSPTDYPPGRCELSTSWSQTLNVDATSFFAGIAPNTILRTKTRVAVSGCGEGFGLVNITVKKYCEIKFNITDTCGQFEQDPTCSLKDEIVDGVYTVRDGIRTGFNPLPICKSFCNEPYCPEFWRKERTYICTSYANMEDAKKRLASVVPSTQYDNSKLTFTDVRYEGGSWKTYPGQTFFVQGGTPGSDCEEACRVRVRVENTQIGSSGNPVSRGQSNITQDYVYYYRTCEDHICPTNPGEEVDIPCTCTQDFGSASTVMQTLRMAGQDIICSSGNIKALPGQ
ncbi:MAG: hypothetical protein ACPLSN_08010, partial [Dictyoglomus turgidum]